MLTLDCSYIHYCLGLLFVIFVCRIFSCLRWIQHFFQGSYDRYVGLERYRTEKKLFRICADTIEAVKLDKGKKGVGLIINDTYMLDNYIEEFF